MKKQTNPTIKAHLVRGAFYLLLMLAVCAIPLALAQSVAKPAAKPSLTGSATGPNVSGIALSRLAKLPIASALRGQANTQAKTHLRRGPAFVEIGKVSTAQLPTPRAPAGVLYDQYDNNTGTGFGSNFHAHDPAFVDYMQTAVRLQSGDQQGEWRR